MCHPQFLQKDGFLAGRTQSSKHLKSGLAAPKEANIKYVMCTYKSGLSFSDLPEYNILVVVSSGQDLVVLEPKPSYIDLGPCSMLIDVLFLDF